MKQSKRLGNSAPERVVVFRALQLGDMLCTIPALRALRMALPEAQITLVGLPWARSFVERFDYFLDDFIEFPGFPGFPEQMPQIQRLPQFFIDVQWLNFDLSLQMQGSGGISNPLVEMFGARRTAGFYLPGQYCPDADLFMPYPVHEPEVWRHLRLMEFLGLPLQGDDLEFPLYRKDWQELRALEAQHRFRPDGYVCLHPGARADARRWPAASFAAVGDALAERGLRVIITGSREEEDLATEVAAAMQTTPINLAGQTSLGSLGALLSGARLLVCNDTGVSHLAAALRTPSVVLFSASDPNRWAPLNTKLHHAVAWASAASPEMVIGEVDQVLNKERIYVS